MTKTAGIALMMLAGLAASAPARADADEKRAEIRAAAREVLNSLYEAQPLARHAVEHSAGYAVFSNFGLKIFFAGGGTGKGVAIDRATRKEIFMRMVEVQAGLGIGIKKFGVVFVFDNQEAYNQFVNSGWEFGGQATAAAKYGDEGASFQGAISVSPGVWMYQITQDGLAAELAVKGTKYMKDPELN